MKSCVHNLEIGSQVVGFGVARQQQTKRLSHSQRLTTPRDATTCCRPIAAELDAGTALTFLGGKNVAYGVDRIVAITEDGRGYVWHELNDCGEKAYDGTVVGEECPALPAAAQD